MSLSWKFFFLLQLIVAFIGATWLFSVRMKRRKLFGLRVLFLLGLVVVLLLCQHFMGISVSPHFYITNFVAILLALGGFVFAVWFCFDCSFNKALVLAASATAAKKIHLDVVVIIENMGYSRAQVGDLWHSAYSFLILILVYVFVYFAFGKRADKVLNARSKWKNNLVGVVILLTAGIFRVIAAEEAITGVQQPSIVCFYDILCLLTCLTMQYVLSENDILQQEKQKMLQAIQLKADYYKISRENIDLINTKCHDMRHQLRYLIPSAENNERYRRQIEEIINVYDDIVKTDNEALNVVLTEKSLLCRKRNIRISCMADGKALSFLEDMDIYSLFGNLLDNAIESVEKLNDDEKRVIDLSVSRKNGFVFIQVMNYFEGELQFDGALPVTQKENRDYHGYGLRSVRLIAEKYHGQMTLKPQDHFFVVDLLIPVP